MEVVVEKFKPFYLGLFVSMLLLVALPVAIAGRCAPGPGEALPCPLGLAASIASAVAAAAAHEAMHYLAARLLGVTGLRLRFSGRLAAIVVDYDYMTPGEYLVVALAPQLLTPLLLGYALAAGGAAGLLACIAAAANLAGGAPDIVNGLYFYMVHRRASELRPLYDEGGGVAGGVVVYPGRLVVYTL